MTYKIENEKDNYWEAGFTDESPLILEKDGEDFVFSFSCPNSHSWKWSEKIATKTHNETWDEFFESFSDQGWTILPLMRELATLAN